MKIYLSDFFVWYVSIGGALIIIWWLRRELADRKSWKNSEDVMISCRECRSNFLVSVFQEEITCPFCQEKMRNTWYKK